MQGINVGKIEDIMSECKEWGLDVLCMTETQMRESLEIDDIEHPYQFIGKGRSKQTRKGGGVAVMWKKGVKIECESIDIGNCEMSEDLLAVRLEFEGKNHKRETIYVCVCYMTVESEIGRVENRRKYALLQKFVEDYRNQKVLIMGDMNGHIGILGEEENRNGELLREVCENMSLEILNETIAEGKVTWRGRESKSAIDYVLVNENARENISGMWIDEEGEFDVSSDHGLLHIKYLCDIDKVEPKKKKGCKWKLKDADWEMFREGMNGSATIVGNTVEALNENTVKEMEGVAKRTIGRTKGGVKRGKRNEWWNQGIKDARKERKRLNKECRKLRDRMERGEDVNREQYEDAWEKYKAQKKKVHILIKNARSDSERKKIDELKEKGEEGSREWYRYLRGDKIQSKVDEIVVNGSKIKDKTEISKEIKKFWQDIGGMNDNEYVNSDVEIRIIEKD